MDRPDAARPLADAGPLTGAPLDLIKAAAAVFMLGDHVNTVLLAGAEPWLWRFGRIAFPLFCLVVACHILRGADPRRYLLILLLFAAGTQPIFALAAPAPVGNVLFTLAAGAAIAVMLLRLGEVSRHAVLALGAALCLAAPLYASSGVDFGLPGMLLPAAMAAVLACGWRYLPWLAGLTFALNLSVPPAPGEPVWFSPVVDALFAGFGTLAVAGLAAAFRGRPRFLPRFALHAFYPGHLALLAALRALQAAG